MKTFLDSVATDLISKYGTDLSRIAVVFPNKRASLFLNASLAEKANKPLWSPSYITISDLFRNHSSLTVADPIKLVCDLHKSFTECTGINETLDHFYGWGQILLADFDDIDKNMADAKKVFANLRDIHELDDISYLTEEQICLIKKFFSNFTEDHNSELKKRFLSLWSHFYDIYQAFNKRLECQGLTYEGALYRHVVSDSTIEFDYDHYVFIGFNVLQKVEQCLFSKLMKLGKATFYWDFDKYYMKDNRRDVFGNEAGHYISSYLHLFPNELDNTDHEIYDNFKSDKSITYIAAPTENAQAHYMSTWLKDNNRIADGKRTAIVLCDESLLKTVIHCLPDEVEQVNITTGYPLSQSPLSALLSSLFALQTSGYVAHSEKFRLHSVNTVLSHPYISYISDTYTELLKEINNPPIFYLSHDKLCKNEALSLLFSPIQINSSDSFVLSIVRWIISILKAIATGVSQKKDNDPLFQESLFQTYTMMNRIEGLIASGDLNVDVITMQRLITQLIQTTSIPFHGEPAIGLQIMGVLETRNLDFDHVLLLSCNDGNMPKGVNDTSFIPYNIRKAYELTTIDNKVAIYAYYFHRLLQRAKDITILYNSSASYGQTGEKSRFMQQLMVESGHKIVQQRLRSGQETKVYRPNEIEKTDVVIEQLLNRFDLSRHSKQKNLQPLLTPTAINRYIRCQLQFFYSYVGNLYELENADDASMERRLFGNIFHTAAEYIYSKIMGPEKHIDKESLQIILKSKVDIEQAVDKAFNKELFKMTSSKRPEYNGLQLINREVLITYLRRLLSIDLQLAPFDVIGLEVDVAEPLDIKVGALHFTTSIGGRIDRLDKITETDADRIRVIDYKTGRESKAQLKSIEDLFDSANLNKHSDYYLQAFTYSQIVKNSVETNPHSLAVSPALLFIQNATGENYDPTLCIDKVPVKDIERFGNELYDQLKTTVSEIFNSEIPFIPTSDTQICAMCPYKGICRYYCISR